MSQFTVKTFRQDPSVKETADRFLIENWPAWFFDAHQPVDTKYPHGLYPGPPDIDMDAFDDYNFVVFEKETEQMVATGYMVSFYTDIPVDKLPEGGWDWGVYTAIQQYNMRKNGEVIPSSNMAMALSINIVPTWRKAHGLTEYCIQAMKELVKLHNIHNLIVPLRPHGKINHQEMDINDYFQLRKDDGKHVDYWLQKHIDSGIQLLQPCRESMIMVDTIEKWEKWLCEKLPTSGNFYFTDRKHTLLGPLEVDVEKNTCTYVEPNVWGLYEV